MPSGLVPQEDQGMRWSSAGCRRPASSALGRTIGVRDTLSGSCWEFPEIDEFIAFAGFDIIAGALRRTAMVGFAKLADWRERAGHRAGRRLVVRNIMGLGFGIEEANVFGFLPPPIQGLSLTGGVEGYLQARRCYRRLAALEAGNRIVAPRPTSDRRSPACRMTLDAGVPRYRAEVDRDQERAGCAD
jgi:hypothetical protein